MKKQRYFRLHLAGMTAAALMLAAIPAMELSAAQTLAGDVNGDGAVSVADAILLQKYLLGVEPLGQDAYDNANVLADDAVDVFDLGMLKRMLVGSADVAANTVTVHLADSGITTEGDDNSVVQIEANTVKITASGIYYLDGTLTDGQIFVETAAEDIGDVELVLNNVTMNNTTRPAIYTSAASGNDKTKLTLVGESTLTDTAETAYTEQGATKLKNLGVIYSNTKLSITRNSTGTLHINSYLNTAVNGEKKISINGGTLVIDTDTVPLDSAIIADADGINSDKDVEIEGGTIDIDASADGIKADGAVYVLGGDVQVKAGNDAVQATTEIAVSAGTVTASGDRGFRLGIGGTVNLTGGTVVATATDYQVDGNEAITFTGTQTVMLFDLTAQWKKANAITIGDQTYTANKKYNFVLVSDGALDAAGAYQVTIGGSPAVHDGDAAGIFQNSGLENRFTGVTAEVPVQ